MHCNRFIGETVVPVVPFVAAATYQECILSYKHLDETLDEDKFIFEV